MNKIVGAILVSWTLNAATNAAAQSQFDDVQIEATHVSGSVYSLFGAGGTIGVSVGSDGILIVDDQFEPLAARIQAALSELNPGPLRFVLNTHFHGDHVGGNSVFGRSAVIIAHENVRERLSTPQVLNGETREPIDPAGWPVVTFDRSVTIHFNGEDIRVIHMPRGHTDGDPMGDFTRSNVVHAGDILFSGLFPFIDLDHGGTIPGYLKALDFILETFPADVRVIAGHGPLSTAREVRASREMIRATVAFVRAEIEAGKSLAFIQKGGLPETWKSFDWQFITEDRWIETIYNGQLNQHR